MLILTVDSRDMRKNIFILFVGLLFLVCSKVQAQEAYFNYKQFFTPAKESYIELYALYPILNSNGALNFEFKNEQVNLFVEIEMFQNDKKTKSVNFKVNSPVFKDSTLYDFSDVYRLQVTEESTQLKISILDLNQQEGGKRAFMLMLNVKAFHDHVFISDVEMSSYVNKTIKNTAFNKQGIYIYPDVNEYFKENVDTVFTYFEVYNLESDKQYFLERNIVDLNQNIGAIQAFKKITKLSFDSTKVVLDKIDIQNLYSGNYQISYVVYEKESKSEIASQQISFFRNKTKPTFNFTTVDSTALKNSFAYDFQFDSLFKAVSSLQPISDAIEERAINQTLITKDHWKAKDNYDALAGFMYIFWKKRSFNNAGFEWEKYNDKVVEAERSFGVRGIPGYKSDRGKLFLKYGKPDEFIARDNDNSTYPYEIWFYKKFDVYINKKFLFYDRTLVGKDYVMLHSNVPGYVQNPYWEIEIQSRTDNSVKSMDMLNDYQGQNSNDKNSTTPSTDEQQRLNELWGGQNSNPFGRENDRVKEMWDRIGRY